MFACCGKSLLTRYIIDNNRGDGIFAEDQDSTARVDIEFSHISNNAQNGIVMQGAVLTYERMASRKMHSAASSESTTVTTLADIFRHVSIIQDINSANEKGSALSIL